MRARLGGRLGRAALVLVPLVAVLWLAPGAIGGALLESVVGTALGRPTTVRVENAFPLALLAGHADALELSSGDVVLGEGRLAARSLRLRLVDVVLLERRAGHVTGELAGVALGAEALPVARIALDGPWEAIGTRLIIAGPDAELLLARALGEAAGLTTARVRLVEGSPAALEILGATRSLRATLAVRDGALVAVPETAGIAPVVLLDAATAAPLALRAVRVEARDLVLEGTVGADALGF